MISGKISNRNGYWTIGWRENGKWHRKSTHIRVDSPVPPARVTRLLAELQERLECGKNGIEYIPKLTIGEALKEWLEVTKRVTKDTPQTYANLASFVPKLFAKFNDKMVCHFNEADFLTIIGDINAGEQAYNTKRNYFSGCSVFMKFCTAKGYTQRNMFNREFLKESFKKIKGDRKPRLERRALTYEEEAKIFSFLKGWPLTCSKVAIWTGARASEAVKIKMQDVDFMKHQIHFREKKLGGRPIIKPMHPTLEAFLRSIAPDDYPPEQKRAVNLSEIFNRAAVKAGVPRATFHWLRHTLASRLFDEGVDERIASAILGHTVAVHRVYAHANREKLLKNLEKVKNVSVLLAATDQNDHSQQCLLDAEQRPESC